MRTLILVAALVWIGAVAIAIVRAKPGDVPPSTPHVCAFSDDSVCACCCEFGVPIALYKGERWIGQQVEP